MYFRSHIIFSARDIFIVIREIGTQRTEVIRHIYTMNLYISIGSDFFSYDVAVYTFL
ncbi:Hypothetical protein ETEE_0255 [Edwardsiella anguillarum ET080813]|uniref:Uncharacterized protein n=1 Tax=Edwardsiella anguillarum ET080813 TaxID=667120 RepID=A0A076LDZ7_9GAMM|nr:Hypothetical protein ETEE_0255 [Edwardsiella anguillarum ET080813]